MADVTFDIPGVGVLTGPEWATEETLKQIKAILEGKLVENSDDLIKLIETLVKGGKVDERVARETMEAAKDTSIATSEATESAAKAKASGDGWMRRTWKQGEKLADTIKDQDIGKHLQEAGGMLAMPIKSLEDAFAKISGLMTAVGASVFNASKKLIASMGKIGAVIGDLMGAVGAAAAGLLSLATGAIGYLLGAITAMGDTFFDLYDTGINFAGSLASGATGLGAMLEASTDARLSLGDFTEFLSKNTSVALAIGASNMADLSKRVRDTIYPMGMFGMGISEVNEYLGDYLEQQRMSGVLGAMDQAQRAKAGAEYIEQITRLSMITGKRRKQIAEELNAQAKSIHVVSYLNSLTADQAALQKGAMDTITGVMRSLDESGDMAKDFTETMFYGSFQASDSFATMVQTGYEVEAQMLSDIQQRVKSGEIDKKTAEKEMAQVVKAMAQNEKAAEITANQIAAGNLAAGQFAGVTNKAKMLEISMAAASAGMSKSEKALGAWDEMQNAVSLTWTKFMEGLFGGKGGNAFSKSMNDAMGTLQEMLKPDGPLIKSLHEMANVMSGHVVKAFEWFQGDGPGKLKTFLQELPSKIKAFSDGIGAAFAAIKGFLMTEKIDEETGKGTGEFEMKSFGKIISTGIGNMFDGIKTLIWENKGKILAALIGIFAAKQFVSVFASRAGTALSGVIGKGLGKVGMGGASKVASSVGGAKGGGKGPMDVIAGAVGKLGKGVGQAIKGLMHGIAGGLSAFKPNVLIGATVFSASIAIIGVGIAAASWIMGKALPALAEGLGGFNDIDGWNLIKVGGGMVALSVGILAMGTIGLAGGVLAGIGGIMEGMLGMVGVDLISRLERFSNAKVDAKKVEANAKAMSAMAAALNAGGAGASVAGIGALVGGITGALGKFFGADDPLTQLKKFGAVNINGAKVKVNAEAMKIFASAMADAPAIKADVIGALFGGIISIFGGNVKMPWDNLKAFADADVDGAKVKVNAEAMKAFASAMTNAPEIETTRVGGIFGAIADIFGGGVKMPWANLKLFADVDVDGAKVKVNAEAMKLFASAMTGMPEISGERVGGIFGAIADIFGGEVKMPWASLKEFADIDIDGAKVKINAGAMKLFATAMETVPSIKPDVIGTLFGAIADVFGAKVKMPWDNLKLFSDVDIDGAKVKVNAEAMKLFATAMETVPSIKPDVIGALFSGVVSIFGGEVKMPWANLKLFAAADIDGAKVKTNAEAMKAFGTAMSDVPEVKSERVGGLMKGIASFFYGEIKMPWAQVKLFADADLGDTTKIAANAKAMKLFASAMTGVPEISGERVGGIFGAIADVFGGNVKMPWASLKEFADIDIDGAKVKVNAEAMNLFAGAMTNVPEIETTRVGGIFGAIADIFGGEVKMPWANLKLFADADLGDTTKIATNSAAMKAFSSAITGVPEIETTRVGGIFGAIADIFGGEAKMPWANLKLFADADIDGAKVTANSAAMKAFSSAMTGIPEISGELVGGIFGAIADIFSGEVTMPWDKVKAFADADMGDSIKLTANAKALGEFGAAISGMPKMPEGKREGGAWGFVKGIFAGDTKMPWDKVKAFADADMGDTTKIVANANALSTFSKTMSGMDLASLEAWGDSDSMDKMSSAFGNLFGKNSPLTQIANLDKISTPLTSAGTALDGFNPKMKTLYNMLKDPAFVTGVGAIKVMTANLGQLDDAVNDWSKNELAQFESITTSLGNFQGAQIKTAGTETASTLKEIHNQLGIINENITAQTAILMQETKKGTEATKQSGMHVS